MDENLRDEKIGEIKRARSMDSNFNTNSLVINHPIFLFGSLLAQLFLLHYLMLPSMLFALSDATQYAVCIV